MYLCTFMEQKHYSVIHRTLLLPCKCSGTHRSTGVFKSRVPFLSIQKITSMVFMCFTLQSCYEFSGMAALSGVALQRLILHLLSLPRHQVHFRISHKILTWKLQGKSCQINFKFILITGWLMCSQFQTISPYNYIKYTLLRDSVWHD